jgi:hypothetical protein
MNRKKVMEYLVSENIPAVDLIVELLNKDETLINLIIKMDRARKGTHDS